ncbi:hypothetical protein KSI01_18420 [Kurthia sibirica]|uniref:Thermonuclease n=2 Tax=Kurthia sibirica TaxID=202750 RepID=A0A2U3AN01_9BACL|nr:thermonuclease [Kurthia sibirica]GEK34309.1 hypothetical protein KSI01_18420 [Kurthia sibirica]
MKKMTWLAIIFSVGLIVSACTETANVNNQENNHKTVGEVVKVTNVMDGDTMKVMYNGKERKVRFLLIDAPEMYHKELGEQPFGREAQTRTRELLKKAKEVSIEFDETGAREDKYNRLLAYVYADGQSVQQQLIKEGLVRVGYVYNKQAAHLDEYDAAQNKAKQAKLGIWQYPGYVTDRGFIKSAVPNWQPGKSLNTSTSQKVQTADCKIKGNINAKGNKNYFLPGDPNYEQVNEEEMFCSQNEAQKAGFKKAQ